MEQIIEYNKTYREYKAELDAELAKTAEAFVKIGYLLKVARDTSILHESGYISVTDFAKAEYNIDKSQVSRFIHINDKFSEGGYGDRLMDNYRGFGYAKLALMLQLPDEINEEITPDYSKSEIQAIKDEVDAERKITDIDVLLEGESHATSIVDDELGKTIKQMGEDDPQLYADIWTGIRRTDWSIEQLQIVLSPSGQKLYSVRIRGIGRKQLIAKDKDNGNEVVLIDLRSSDKKYYTWEDVNRAWWGITVLESEKGFKGAWESIYFMDWPIKEKVAPVQQPLEEKKIAPKKETKVQKAPIKEKQKEKEVKSKSVPEEVNKEEVETATDIIDGQTDIEKDFIDCIKEPEEKQAEENNKVVLEEIIQTTSEDNEEQRNGYMVLVRTYAENLVNYANMGLYEDARHALKDLNKFIDMMEELHGVSKTEEL